MQVLYTVSKYRGDEDTEGNNGRGYRERTLGGRKKKVGNSGRKKRTKGTGKADTGGGDTGGRRIQEEKAVDMDDMEGRYRERIGCSSADTGYCKRWGRIYCRGIDTQHGEVRMQQKDAGSCK
jgi:hypothetical protein